MNCGFTIKHYKEIIELARDSGYTIFSPLNHPYGEDIPNKYIVLIHDIDWSLECAYELANIEYDLGIQSVYYVYLHAGTYNALAPKSMKMIREMRDMGHEIGLHYDSRYSLSHEVDILSKIAGKGIYSCSQHFFDATVKETYQGILDVSDMDLKYISDSGRNWREKCLCQNIDKHKKLRVLIHPEWWVTNSLSREDAVHKLWNQLQNSTIKEMQEIKVMLLDYTKSLGIKY